MGGKILFSATSSSQLGPPLMPPSSRRSQVRHACNLSYKERGGKIELCVKEGNKKNYRKREKKKKDRESTEGERTKDGLAHFGCGVGVGVGAHLDFISKRCCLVTRTLNALMSDISM